MTGWRTSISLQPFVQTRGSLLYTSIGLLPCVSEPFELWILVCVHASVSSLVFQTRLDGDSLFVYKHKSPALCFSSPVFQTRLICGSLSVYTHPSTLLCFKHFCLLLLVCLHASVLSQNGYGMGQTETPLREEWGFVEKLCYMSLDYDTELKSTSESSDKIQTYELPDGNIISLGAERFRSTSVLPASVIGIQASGILDFFPEQHEVLRELPQ